MKYESLIVKINGPNEPNILLKGDSFPDKR